MTEGSGTIGRAGDLASAPKEVMRIDDAAVFLGVSKGVLYRWVSEGRVPVVRISKRCIRFRRSSLEMWLDDMTAPYRKSK